MLLDTQLTWRGRIRDSEVPHYDWIDGAESGDVALLDVDDRLVPETLNLYPLSFEDALSVEYTLGESPDLSTSVSSRHPAIAGCHVSIRTRDNYMLCALRRESALYQPGRWSVSFEEQVKGGKTADVSPVSTALRGLAEEFSEDFVQHVASAHMTGIGRENYQEGTRIVRSAFITMALRISLASGEFFDMLSDGLGGVDAEENSTWVLIKAPHPDLWLRSASPDDLVRSGAAIRAPQHLAIALSKPWHATSRARIGAEQLDH